MKSAENIERYEFFTPGEVCFFFEHDPTDADRIDELFRKNKELWRLFEEAAFRCLDVQTFEAGEDDKVAYSLVYAQLPVPPDLSDERLRALNDQVIRLIDEVLEGIQRKRYADSPLHLTGVTPNWFSGAAQHIIDGGPGAMPVDASMARDELKPLTADIVERHINQRQIEQKAYEKADVDVYVLDSIPLADSWVRVSQLPESHARLLDLMSKMTISTAADLGVVLPDQHFEIAGHMYEMSDHGLFIAGLIHDSALEANIHLLEVLNKYGVGTLKSLLAGLQAIPNIKRPTIINCSLMMAARSSMLIQKFPNWKRLAEAEPDPKTQRFTGKQLRMPLNSYLAALMQPLERIIQQRVAALGGNRLVKIVASAGNDSRGNRERKPARYPAAFPKVIGVGALDRKNHPAAYSNYADNPLYEGIAAFGGLADMATHTADVNDGIAGLYIGRFPDGTPSNGTARWAGTSFAAGVVSGLLARLVRAGYSCDEAEHILRSERSFDVPDVVTAEEQ
jgi:hypothetical protein